MRRRFGLLFFLACVCAEPVFAVSVTNKDDREFKLTIVEADNKQDHLLKPNDVLDGICLKGCILRLGDSVDDEYVLEGPEVVSIEDAKIYDDGPDGRSDAVPGRNTKPPPTDTPPAAKPSK